MTTASARLLDITRLVNRAGLNPTGVDRVEAAYLRAFYADHVPVYAIARTALGYVIIDKSGVKSLLQAMEKGAWGRPDLLGGLNPKLDAPRRRGQAFVRRIAFARCLRSRLGKTLKAVLPDGFTYFNVGHSNLNARMFEAMGSCKTVVLIHDTIPLDHPDTQASGAVARFRAKLALVSQHASVVICTSTQCKNDVTRHMSAVGRVPPLITAHLGVDAVAPDADMTLPLGPYFVTVGTIEPRKNHALLLDIWADWADAPPLVICGKRGWNNDAVFARLDALPAQVVECNDLSDGQIAALVAGARAMLFPSSAEGFGLPPVEALMLGTPVVCADLPVYGEILGNEAVYVKPNDRYLWEKKIKNLAASGSTDQISQFSAPTWESHFKTVLSLT